MQLCDPSPLALIFGQIREEEQDSMRPASEQQTHQLARVSSGTTTRVSLVWRYRTVRASLGPPARRSRVLLEVGGQRVGRRDVHAVGFDELR